MAVITISRQVAALGDEVSKALASKMGYTFIDRKILEKKIIDIGFPEAKLKKYDEKKPGFFASLAKDRDEYLDYLQTAVYEAASIDNCILIGRGSFFILQDVPNTFSVRFVAKDSVRIQRLMNEFSWDEKQARQRVEESDANRLGFHKSFFNLVNEDPSHFHLTINTGLINEEEAASTIASLVPQIVTPDLEVKGKKRLEELTQAQKVVNELIFVHKLNINFLKAVISGNVITLQGVAESSAISERAISIAKEMMPDMQVVSAISIVQDFKAYP